MFSMRFIVSGSRPRRDGQALFRRRSGISLFGGLLLLVYAVDRVDPAFIVGQAAGFVIYARNIHFIWLGRRAPSPANVA